MGEIIFLLLCEPLKKVKNHALKFFFNRHENLIKL